MWLLRLSSFSGDYLYQMAIIWMAWTLSDSVWFTGSVAAAYRLPFWCFGLFAGIVADRFNRQSIVIRANTMRWLLSLCILSSMRAI
ncbi:hypothetical protein GCU85_05815 [Cardiobacteriales bacterium ML27]|uniref:MFS transporter n=1 Tax=Ostreibacterium oceani TaxID=2654998 RepID=A0A6N7F308_9GAMM|nr:hypothetical protein [Ostreibacterium oceani]